MLTQSITQMPHLLHGEESFYPLKSKSGLATIFLWGGKTCCALIATPNVDNANRRQKKGKS
jgi:hypothetical protein